MTSEQFCLKWNNYQSNIVSALGNLKLDEDFVDVTLSCEGRTIKAHKVILSACSLYFRDVFRETPCNHPIIILKDTQYSDLESLVKYVYQGQVYISQENLTSFLKTADTLQIKGLAEQSQPPESSESSPNSSPNHGPSPVPEAKPQQQQPPSSFPSAPPMSPILSSSSHPTVVLPSQQVPCSSAPPLLPRTSPIKIPTISHLKRSTFSNLAQYLSGSHDMSSPPLNDEPGSHSKKRKLTPPMKRYELPNYSGSTSTASPGSPPHSHSTEGGEQSLEIGEESDRDSSRSIESNDLVVKAPLLSDYEPSTKDSHVSHLAAAPYHHHHHSLHNHQHRLAPPSIEKKDHEDFGETLDLSKNSSRHIHHQSHTYLNSSNNSISNMPTTHISGGVLEAALTASDPMSSSRSLGSISPAKRLGGLLSSGGSVPTSTSSSSAPTTSTTLPPNSGSGIKEKDVGQGSAPEGSNNALSSSSPPPANKNSNNINNSTNSSNHPRNRWRCMQPRICNYCWKTFSNSFNLKQHIVNVHVQSQGVSCSLCEKVVKNKWYLRKHLVTAHGAPLKRVKGSEKNNEKAATAAAASFCPNTNNKGGSSSSKHPFNNNSRPGSPLHKQNCLEEESSSNENDDSNKSLEVN